MGDYALTTSKLCKYYGQMQIVGQNGHLCHIRRTV